MNNIDFFKSQANFLKKDYNKQQSEAICRCNKVFVNKHDLSLMNFQHIIAKEAGFNNWNELRSANENQLKVAQILYKYQTINGSGYRFNYQELGRKSASEQKEYMIAMRKELLDNSDFIIVLSHFLELNIQKTSTVRNAYSSYKIKHIIERSLKSFGINENYVSNGELIVAAIVSGFNFRPCTSQYTGLSVYFNMLQKSLISLPGYRG